MLTSLICGQAGTAGASTWSAGVHMSDDEDDVIDADLAALMDSAAAMRPAAGPETNSGPLSASCSGRHHQTPSMQAPPIHQVRRLHQAACLLCTHDDSSSHSSPLPNSMTAFPSS